MSKTLLPSGCYDILPPYARQESELSSTLLGVFESFGYEQVSPPLLEFSDNLLAGRGATLSAQIFRVMDPRAHKVMGLRPDITLQIARIAAGRLADAPRPLRLCYNGLILRMQGEVLKSDRQLRQAGIELIGASSAQADAEVIMVAAEALRQAGIGAISIDLNLPGIVSALLANESLGAEDLQCLFAAVAHKDISTIKSVAFSHQQTLIGLLQSAGAADSALAAIDKLALPEAARRQCEGLRQVVTLLKEAGNPDWPITVDAAEQRGFDYHSGISFSIFVPGAQCEVGRGGRYLIDTEEATGFTLYVETLRDLLKPRISRKRLFIAQPLPASELRSLQGQGYATICALPNHSNDASEAKRLRCTHIYHEGKISELSL